MATSNLGGEHYWRGRFHFAFDAGAHGQSLFEAPGLGSIGWSPAAQEMSHDSLDLQESRRPTTDGFRTTRLKNFLLRFLL